MHRNNSQESLRIVQENAKYIDASHLITAGYKSKILTVNKYLHVFYCKEMQYV